VITAKDANGSLRESDVISVNINDSKPSRKISRWIWFTAWTIALLARFIFPLADPPLDLSWSGGYMADEGFWVHDARSIALFGEPASDQWHNRIVSPLIHYPVLLLFSLFGVKLLSVRIWAAILSIFSLFFLDRIIRRLDPSGYLFLAFAVNSTLVAFQRVAILESAVLPVALLTMWLWLLSRENILRQSFISMDLITGISAALIWQIKSTQLYMIPAVMLATFLMEPSRKRARRAVFLQAAGVFIVSLIWFCFIRLPNKDLLAQYNSYYLSQQGRTIIDFLKNLLIQPIGIYFSRLPVFFPAGVFLAFRLIFKGRFKFQPPVITFAWSWLITGILFMAPLGYRPFRYYLPLIIPTMILGWRCLVNKDQAETPGWITWLAGIATLLVVMANIPLLTDFFITNGKLLGIQPIAGFPIAASLICLPVTVVILLVKGRKNLNHFKMPAIIFLMLLLSYSFQITDVTRRMLNRQYSIMETSTTLAEILPVKSVLAGQWAPELVMETPFRAVPVWKEFVNWEDPFRKYGITHILSWEYQLGNELDKQKEWFPEVMRNARLIQTFHIKNSDVSLWEISKLD